MQHVIGFGSYVPSRVVTNEMLAEIMDTSDEWITKRTGIKQRYFADDDEYVCDIGYKAAVAALEDAGIGAESIDLLIVATCTHHQKFPSSACAIGRDLGVQGVCFDVSAACSGFVYALEIAASLMQVRKYRNALIIGAERFSTFFNVQNRSSSVLFGDGAGAFVLSSDVCSENTSRTSLKLKDTYLASDCALYDDLYVDHKSCMIAMNGASVFKHAVQNMTQAVEVILSRNGLNVQDIDMLVPHQANVRILEAVASALHMNTEKVVSSIAVHSNTSAASIPLACDFARESFLQAEKVVLVSMGAGFTWGAVLLER